MMEISVVVHREYGKRYVVVLPENPPLGAYEIYMSSMLKPVIDRSHGTRRSVEEVRALFQPEESVAYAAGWNVNSIWNTAGVHFVLVGIVDEMLESHEADLLPADTGLLPNFKLLNYSSALNVYMFRELEDRRGSGVLDLDPNADELTGRILLSDRWHLEETYSTREQTWRQEVNTLAHEFGHALSLQHMKDSTNLMYGGGTIPESIEISLAQGAVTKFHGRKYNMPWYREVKDMRVVDVPVVTRTAGEILPRF